MKLKSIRRLSVLVLVLMALNSPPGVCAESIELDGVIEPSLIVKVGSAVRGVLDTIDVDRGDMVRKGQVLARLESGVERATMEFARARAETDVTIKLKQTLLDFSLRKRQRMEELYQKKDIPFEQMDEVKTNAALARMELEDAKEKKRFAELELKRSIEAVNRMTIHSRIAGVVMERFLAPGEYVENQPILQLAQIDPLNVEVFAPVELLGLVKVGMPAEVTPEKPIGGVYTAEVNIVDRVVDAASGTYGVRLELPNPEYKLPAGLKCKVTFLKTGLSGNAIDH